MIADPLNTNQVKNSAGTEVEFQSLEVLGRKKVFAKVGESPALPHRLSISHTESGSGLKQRRRSAIRVDITSISTVDNVTPVVSSAVGYIDAPVGATLTNAEVANALAELSSFISTLGTNTHLYDGTGNGAAALLSGSL